MNLYFENSMTTITTIMLISLITVIAYTFINRADINHWELRTLFLAVYGLVICCFVAVRDELDKNIIVAACNPTDLLGITCYSVDMF